MEHAETICGIAAGLSLVGMLLSGRILLAVWRAADAVETDRETCARARDAAKKAAEAAATCTMTPFTRPDDEE